MQHGQICLLIMVIGGLQMRLDAVVFRQDQWSLYEEAIISGKNLLGIRVLILMATYGDGKRLDDIAWSCSSALARAIFLSRSRASYRNHLFVHLRISR
ncbi:hypothetical protein F4781DRAFT_408158 [Annulohypoxylon bovei var. microspora]|nr:hypothetical protein F4781DRAFT_408158 [Annulohypoxylon bovei var. microspora]